MLITNASISGTALNLDGVIEMEKTVEFRDLVGVSIFVILASEDELFMKEYETIEEANEWCEEYVYAHEGEPFYLWSGKIGKSVDKEKALARAEAMYKFEVEWRKNH